jgi:hypothetical protein
MADRPTSAAKSVEGLHHEESALDRALALRDQFARAQNQQEHQRERETQQSKGAAQQGSQMVKDSKPPLAPTPKGPMRQSPERQAYNAKLGKEHENAEAKLEAARKLQESLKARQGKSHDHDRDHER